MSEIQSQGERRPYNKPRGPRPEEKKINTNQVVSFLNRAFARASQNVMQSVGNRNYQGSKLYHYQVEFCYMIDEIQRGPTYMLPKVIQDANFLIERLEKEETAQQSEDQE